MKKINALLTSSEQGCKARQSISYQALVFLLMLPITDLVKVLIHPILTSPDALLDAAARRRATPPDTAVDGSSLRVPWA
eukprot:SAG11_NODE_1697_length_4431_cov_2.166667_2_plen_79_part_00